MTLTVSLIFLNWNGRDYLGGCLPSALALDYVGEYEVIVVDNGSSDDSVEYVRRGFPQVRVIENGRNLGYAGGMNVGLRAAQGDVAVILNNDVILRSDWLAELLAPMAADPQIGIAGCKIFYPDGETLQHAGGAIYPPRMAPDHFGYREIDEGKYDELRDVDYVTSAAMAIRLEMLGRIGYLDDGFFPIYYDDVDICFRARDAGYRVVYVPRSTMIHLESATVGYASPRYLLNMHRSRLRFALKRLGPREFVDSFVPAETAWLRLEASPNERMVLPQVYLASMLAYPNLCLDHWSDHDDEGVDAVRDVLGALADLRERVWGSRMEEKKMTKNVDKATTPEDELEQWLLELKDKAYIREQPFVSDKPIIGRLIVFVRETWNSVATKWYVRPLLQQQNRFNQILIERLNELDPRMVGGERDVTQLARTTAEGEYRLRRFEKQVTQEISHLNQRLARLEEMLALLNSLQQGEGD